MSILIIRPQRVKLFYVVQIACVTAMKKVIIHFYLKIFRNDILFIYSGLWHRNAYIIMKLFYILHCFDFTVDIPIDFFIRWSYFDAIYICATFFRTTF